MTIFIESVELVALAHLEKLFRLLLKITLETFVQ
jgi:hypothetical protein